MKSIIALTGVLFLFVITAKAQTPTDTKSAAANATPASKTVTTPAKTFIGSTAKTSTGGPVKTTAKRSGSKFDADRAVAKAGTSVDKANTTANNALNVVDNATKKTKELGTRVKKMAPQRATAAAVVVATNTTQIKIKGLNFATLNKLNENIQGCPGVKSSSMDFSGSKATITVSHSGTSASLLKLIEGKSKDIFTDENIDDFKEGKVSIKIKQP